MKKYPPLVLLVIFGIFELIIFFINVVVGFGSFFGGVHSNSFIGKTNWRDLAPLHGLNTRFSFIFLLWVFHNSLYPYFDLSVFWITISALFFTSSISCFCRIKSLSMVIFVEIDMWKYLWIICLVKIGQFFIFKPLILKIRVQKRLFCGQPIMGAHCQSPFQKR